MAAQKLGACPETVQLLFTIFSKVKQSHVQTQTNMSTHLEHTKRLVKEQQLVMFPFSTQMHRESRPPSTAQTLRLCDLLTRHQRVMDFSSQNTWKLRRQTQSFSQPILRHCTVTWSKYSCKHNKLTEAQPSCCF